MLESVDRSAPWDNSARYVDVDSPAMKRGAWPQGGPRAATTAPRAAAVSESTFASPQPSAMAIPPSFSSGHEALFRGIDETPPSKAKLASVAVSACAFAIWIVLMVTVVAENGSIPQIVGITMIPFLGHVISLWLAAVRTPSEPAGSLET